MPPDDLATAPPPASPAAPAEQPAAPIMFTAEQVAERERVAAQKAHDAAEAAARRRYEERQKPASTPAATTTPQPNAAPSAGLTIQDFTRFAAFTAVASEVGIPPAGVEMLMERVMAEKPTDVRAWTTAEATRFGWSKQPAAPTVNPTPGPAPGNAGSPAPLVTPTPTPGGPPPAPSAGQFRAPVIQWSQAELDAHAAKNGGPASVYRQFVADMASTRFAISRNK